MNFDNDKTGFSFEKINGTECVVHTEMLSYSKFKVVVVTPVAHYYSKLNTAVMLILLFAFFVVVFGVALNFYLTSKIYKPLRDILKRITGLVKDDKEYITDEYGLINETLLSFRNNIEHLCEDAVIHKKTIAINRFVKLLSSEQQINADTVMNELGECVPDLDKYQMIRFVIIKDRLLNETREEQISEYTSQYVRYLSDGGNVYIMPMELSDEAKGIMFLYNKSAAQEVENHILAVSQLLQSEGVEVCFIVSKSDQVIEHAQNVFQETTKMVRYTFLFPHIRILYAEELDERDKSEKRIPQKLIDKLYDKMSSKNPDLILDAWDDVLSELANGCYSYSYIQLLLLDIVSATVREFRIATGQFMRESFYRNDFENIDDFNEWFSKIITESCEVIRRKELSQNQNIIRKVEEYIANHLDEDISIKTISEVVFMSESNFSRIFKSETGMTFTNYLTLKRLETAEFFIKNTNKNINEIAGKCGFHNDSYFIRCFKKKYGVTPTAYRKNIFETE